MANLTITVDDEVLKQARIRALEQGTSVNALLNEHLIRYARIRSKQEEAVDSLLRLARQERPEDERSAEARGGRRWRREDLYER
jgi:hypothetical protein